MNCFCSRPPVPDPPGLDSLPPVGCLGHPPKFMFGGVSDMSAADKTMDSRYKGWTRDRRMNEAVRKVVEDGMSQAEAARRLGVTRSRVNVNVNRIKKQQAETAARSEAALAERVAAFEAGGVVGGVDPLSGVGAGPQEVGPVPPPPSAEPVFEVRRIQPPDVFLRDYFGAVVCPDCGVHHDVPGFHDEIISRVADPAVRRLLVNLAPYHAKSTVGTVYSTVYEICRDPNSRTAIVSKAERLARNFLYQIKKLLTDPEMYRDAPRNLIEDWGPFHNPNSWSQTDIFVAGRSSSEKDPTVSVYGVGAQIYGYRFDRMIFDDIADLENQRNGDRVQEMLQWATQECASRVGKTGKLIFVGTRVSPGDIYSYLQDLPAYEVLRYPCILDEVEQSTLWPGHFPYRAAVEQRDSMSIEQFQLVYQNVDSLGMGAAFPFDVLEATRDGVRPLGHWDPSWRLVLGVDPAGAGEQAGYTAMVVLGVDVVTGERFIVDLVNQKQMRAPQIKDQIIEFADRYPLSEIRVEVNGLQSQLFQYDLELISKLTQRGIRFVPHITHGKGGRGGKWDEQFGVESMGPMFYNRQISCPWADVNSRRKVGELHDQLSQFPMGTVSDLVMALWFADLGCRDLFQRFKLPAFDSRARVPSRIRNKRHVVDFGQGEVRAPTHDEVANIHGGDQQRRRLVNVQGDVAVWS
jgi:predicted XRE-type DNA-binding protein